MSEPARILVVDDDQAIRATVGLLLTDEGYEALEAPDGEAAFALLATQHPDLILLDMTMPGMDGREFARRYRSGPGPHAPIIVFTAARIPAGGLPDIQADGFLAKPFDLDDLLALIERHLAAAPQPFAGEPDGPANGAAG